MLRHGNPVAADSCEVALDRLSMLSIQEQWLSLSQLNSRTAAAAAAKLL